MMLLAPDAFMINGKAWIEAVSGVLDMAIAKVGVLTLALLAVWQNIKAKAAIQEVKDRQDRQGARIDAVALAVPATPAATVKIEQPADEAVPVVAAGGT